MPNEQQISEILIDQAGQLQNKEPGVPRDVDYKYLAETHFITVITGIRRCGKSILMLQLTKYFDDFYYVNFDDERFFDFTVSDFQTLMIIFKKKVHSKNIFLDEIQNITGWERFVRRIYDEGYKVFITGSNSKLLSSELASHLTGRYIKIELFPFSFNEYLKFKKIDTTALGSDNKSRILASFDTYLTEGGFPEYMIYSDGQQLQNIYEDIIYKDLVTRFGIKNSKALKQLAHYYYTNFTKEVSYNSLKTILSINSVATIKDYTEYLEQSYMLFECYKFDYSLKKQYTYSKKVYTIDNGLRNRISFRFNTDSGQLLENLVYIHLRKQYKQVFFYKTTQNHEVDFCIQSDTIKLYQVCYMLDDFKTRERETRSLVSAMDELNTNEATILTYNSFDEFIINDKTIQVIPVWYWMLRKNTGVV